MTFYDSHGKPIAYVCDDGIHIYLFTGQPIAYLYDNAVYGYNGHQFGWFENGWIRDLNGLCVFFIENASGLDPVKPFKQIKPVKGVKHMKPVKSIKNIKCLKTVKSLSWSALSGLQFFYS